MEISFSQGGSAVNMRSCATCHRRSWHRDDEPVDLAAVLAAVQTKRSRERGAGDD